MTKIVTSLLAGTAFFGLVAIAQAADMGSPLRGPSIVQPMADPVVSGSWYLRGDVGVAIAGRPSIEDIEVGLPKTIIHRDMTDAPMIQLGVGYQINEYLRGDITAEYRGSSRLRGVSTYASTYTVGGVTSPSTNYVSYDTHTRSLAFMANGYVDMGTWSGLTPYVGAGIGAAYNQMSDGYIDTTYYVAGSPQVPQKGVMAGNAKWNFAWALHTGMSWDVNPNLKLDVGYSYKDYGSITSGNLTCFSGTGCNEQLKVKNLGFHDVHIGARWVLDPATPKSPVYASAPVVAKY